MNKSKPTRAPLGQHLLTNTKIAERVAAESGAAKGVRVLEVGPGKGILTAELLALGAEVHAVEVDPAMIEHLRERFAKEIRESRLKIYAGDARTVTPDSIFPKKSYVVAANIPYYITGELIRTFVTAHNQPVQIALLVQKEVAERIARSKKESILSLSVKVYGTPKYVTTVKAGNFNPPPKVDSAILKISDISRRNFVNVTEQKFFEIIKVGFGQKRKALAGNLKRALGTDMGVEPGVRAEDVSLADWLVLSSRRP